MDCEGVAPGVGAADIPGYSSARNRWESPILSSACMIRPSGLGMRLSSVAPKAFLYNSIAAAAFLQVRPGVMVWNPSGIALTGMEKPPKQVRFGAAPGWGNDAAGRFFLDTPARKTC